ncbi:MAG: polyamine aminopropyltransferase [Actinomycetota bacterium]|nr:polyamine aminopropyltransferase [Actinomycetota bacterium]MDI6822715.1 polyamine aminopropyltransferase [Actinomycetota bacterium]
MTDDWFTEPGSSGFEHRYKVRAISFKKETAFQRIEIVDTLEFGRMLVLNGAVQTSEKDEFIYHEMLVHVPLLSHTKPRRILIIGGGDGGALRRVLEHPVEDIVLVELDEEVVKACRKFLPSINGDAFLDKRVKIIFDDGAKFVGNSREKFDVLIVDSTDPIGPAKALFTEGFYRAAHNILSKNGICVTQSGSPTFQMEELRNVYNGLKQVFPTVRVYLAFVPTYPGVLWSFTIASKKWDPAAVPPEKVKERLISSNISTRYYTPEIHTACFILPKFIQGILEEDTSFETAL